MANIKYGSLVADIRGSIAGTTFSRGNGGGIVRNNPKPCNPRSIDQNVRRATLAFLSQYWSKTLTPAQRTAWADYAANTAWTNKVGSSAIISGLAAFVRLNSLILLPSTDPRRVPGYYEWPLRADAPTSYGHAGTPTFTILADGADLSVNIQQPTAPWVNNNNFLRMVFFIHSPTAPGAFALGKQRIYLGAVEASAGVPAVFPKEYTSLQSFNNGQRVSVTGIFMDAEYRVGGDFTADVLAATP